MALPVFISRVLTYNIAVHTQPKGIVLKNLSNQLLILVKLINSPVSDRLKA